MRYFADVLTAFRFIMATVVLVSIWQDAWVIATIAFLAGILSDAFDGAAARAWPYSQLEEERLPWRKNPHAFDNAADLSLSTTGLVGLSLSLAPLQMAFMVMLCVAFISLFFVRTIAYEVEQSRPKRAERIDVVHGFVYGAELAAMLLVMTAQATDSWPFVALVYLLAAAPLLWFKRDRLMSRDEVSYDRG